MLSMHSRLAVLLSLVVALGGAQEFDSVAQTTEMVTMRDSIRLATDIYRPARGNVAAEGKFPVLIYRTPYNKNAARNSATFFARNGYVVLAQDCRGRFASEGEFYAFVGEGLDGYDTIEWAAAQAWSSGKVGTIGASYLAWDQYHAAMYKPPHLTAMFANVGGATFFDEYAYPGGTPNLGWPLWILGSARSSPQAAQNTEAAQALGRVMADPAKWLARYPADRAAVFQDFPAHRQMYEDFYSHPSFDAYWKQKGFYTTGYHREMKDVPIFFISGWYDYFGEGVIDNFVALSRLQKMPKKLWMGPWPHGIGGANCGNGAFGEQAAVREAEIALDWFDHWLKGKPLEKIGPEPVRIFRMGGGDGKRTSEGRLNHGGEWVNLEGWPPVAARPARYFIRSEGALSTMAPGRETPSTFVFDPENPVPTIGGRYGLGQLTPNCAQDQVCSPKILGCTNSAPLKDRADVLSFSTPPLESAVDVVGKVRARLWISSDAPDTDFTAKLIDVYPDGYALILTDGQLRTRYRNGASKSEMIKPGMIYEIGIDLGSTSNRFGPGHRIRVDISSSNYPKFETNTNTGEHPYRWSKKVKANNTVYHQSGRASYIELPVMK
jgi:putative CocE/NonD family hydrolase